jgi:hypothetical protein
MDKHPESPKSNWESVSPRKRDIISITAEEDKARIEKANIEIRKKLNSTKSSEDLTLAMRLEAKLTLGRSRSMSPRETPPYIDLNSTAQHRSLSLNEMSRNPSQLSESMDSGLDMNRRYGRPRATNAFSGNEPPPILNVDTNRRSSSFIKIKREERLKNLRRYSISLPTFLLSSSPPSSPTDMELEKKKGKSHRSYKN